MSLTISSTATLSSGRQIPRFGFGSPPAAETYEAVLEALRLGIRHGELTLYPREQANNSRYSSDVRERASSRPSFSALYQD